MTAHRYRQLPVEAMQYRPDIPNCRDVARFLSYADPDSFCGDDEAHDARWILTSVMTAHSGDWIIRGVQGEFCVVKPHIFTATYELVEEER